MATSKGSSASRWTEGGHGSVGVVGSILVDIVVEAEAVNRIDAVGEVPNLHIGGCAYNISYWLKQLGCDVGILSAYKRNSVFTPHLLRKLDEEGIGREDLILRDSLPEGIFVAQKSGREVLRAFTSTCIDAVDFDEQVVRAFVGRHDIIACDLGLSANQLSTLLRIAKAEGRKLICNATSDDRVERISRVDSKGALFALVMNQGEVKSLIPNYLDLLEKRKFAEIRRACHAENVVVTLGKDGMLTISSTDVHKAFPAETVQNVKSTIGAGDALTACLTAEAVFAPEDDLDIDKWSGFAAKMGRIMPLVLGTLSATRNSAFEDEGAQAGAAK